MESVFVGASEYSGDSFGSPIIGSASSNYDGMAAALMMKMVNL